MDDGLHDWPQRYCTPSLLNQPRHFLAVLVAAARAVDHQNLFLPHLRGDFLCLRECVRACWPGTLLQSEWIQAAPARSGTSRPSTVRSRSSFPYSRESATRRNRRISATASVDAPTFHRL